MYPNFEGPSWAVTFLRHAKNAQKIVFATYIDIAHLTDWMTNLQNRSWEIKWWTKAHNAGTMALRVLQITLTWNMSQRSRTIKGNHDMQRNKWLTRHLSHHAMSEGNHFLDAETVQKAARLVHQEIDREQFNWLCTQQAQSERCHPVVHAEAHRTYKQSWHLRKKKIDFLTQYHDDVTFNKKRQQKSWVWQSRSWLRIHLH